jgi:hypothetical protein
LALLRLIATSRSLNGVMGSLNTRVQEIAVAIVEHGAGQGNGDMSRALTLVQTVNRHKTLNVAFLIGWFRYFGQCNVNLRANDGQGKVSLIAREAKNFRPFDVAGARANNWYDAFNANGERARWYEGSGTGGIQTADYRRSGRTHEQLRYEHGEARRFD